MQIHTTTPHKLATGGAREVAAIFCKCVDCCSPCRDLIDSVGLYNTSTSLGPRKRPETTGNH